MTQLTPRLHKHNNRNIEYADALGFHPGVIDVHKALKTKDIVQVKNKPLVVKASFGEATDNTFLEKLDVTTWLPFAAPKYHISPHIEDYIFVPVFTIPSDLPNRNGVAFPLRSLLEFRPERGMQAYKTFKGQPVQYEHDNLDITKASGVIIDASLKRLNGYGQGKVWKLMELLAIDRSKNPQLAMDVLSNNRNSYSMGALVESYSCSYCNSPLGQCNHITARQGCVDFYEKDGKLVFKNVHGIDGIETSSVATPAYHCANSNWIME